MKPKLWTLAGAFGLLLVTGSARATVVAAPVVTVAQGGTGMFDVMFTNTDAMALDVSTVSFQIATTNPGILFTSATSSTTGSYVFTGDSGADLLLGMGPDIAISIGTTITASDFAAGSSDQVAAGETVSLGRVTFTVAPNAAVGSFAAEFDPAVTSIADVAGNPVAFDFVNGQINVTAAGGAAAPEPSSLLLAAFALAGLLFATNSRRRTQNSSASRP